MNFGYTIVYVPNVETTLQFYEEAFGLNKSFLHESKQYGEMSTGETKLAFASEQLATHNGLTFSPNKKNGIAPGFEIALVTDHVDSAYKMALSAGAIAVKQPKKNHGAKR